MAKIETSLGTYNYEVVHIANGIKKIDRNKAKENLLLFKKCMEQSSIPFGLIYGTLLGAVREGNFIAHDEDTDVFILKEYEQKLLNALFYFRSNGFEVGRYNGKLISLIRQGEYIDVYFFEKKNKKTRASEGYVIPAHYLENIITYPLFGTEFPVPYKTEQLLVHLYGKDWQIPKVNTPASNYGLYLSIRFFIFKHFKPLFHFISYVKKTMGF